MYEVNKQKEIKGKEKNLGNQIGGRLCSTETVKCRSHQDEALEHRLDFKGSIEVEFQSNN